jgi:diacylglycerol kinase (ATP)
MVRPDNPDVPRHAGLTRVARAFLNSVAGIRSAYQSEAAFRQEIWISAILIPAAFWVGEGVVERLLLIGSVLLVLIVELLNSAIEAVVDRISLEWHDLSKHAKDVGSAAVLLALLNCGVVWVAVAVF